MIDHTHPATSPHQKADRHWRECLEAVEDLLRVRPNEAAALEMKGDALTNLGRRPEALAAYEAAATVDPSDANLRQKIEEVRVDVPSLLSRALIASANGNYTAALRSEERRVGKEGEARGA